MRKHSNYACSTACALYPGPDDTGANVTYGRVANSTNDPTLYSLVLETVPGARLLARITSSILRLLAVFLVSSPCARRPVI